MSDKSGKVLALHTEYLDTIQKVLDVKGYADARVGVFDDAAVVGDQETYSSNLDVHNRYYYDQFVVRQIVDTVAVSTYDNDTGLVDVRSAKYGANVKILKQGDGKPDQYLVRTFFNLTNQLGPINFGNAYSGGEYIVHSSVVANKMAEAFGPSLHRLIEGGGKATTIADDMAAFMKSAANEAGAIFTDVTKANSAVGASVTIVKTVLNPAHLAGNLKEAIESRVQAGFINRVYGPSTLASWRPEPGSPFARVTQQGYRYGLYVSSASDLDVLKTAIRTGELTILDPTQGILQRQHLDVVNSDPEHIGQMPGLKAAAVASEFIRSSKVAPKNVSATIGDGNEVILTNQRGVAVMIDPSHDEGFVMIDRPTAGIWDAIPNTGRFSDMALDHKLPLQLFPAEFAALLADDKRRLVIANDAQADWVSNARRDYKTAENGGDVILDGADWRGTKRRLAVVVDKDGKTIVGGDDAAWVKNEGQEYIELGWITHEPFVDTYKKSDVSKPEWLIDLSKFPDVSKMPPTWFAGNMRQVDTSLGRLNTPLPQLQRAEQEGYYEGEWKKAQNIAKESGQKAEAVFTKMKAENPRIAHYDELPAKLRQRVDSSVAQQRRTTLRGLNIFGLAPRSIVAIGSNITVHESVSGAASIQVSSLPAIEAIKGDDLAAFLLPTPIDSRPAQQLRAVV